MVRHCHHSLGAFVVARPEPSKQYKDDDRYRDQGGQNSPDPRRVHLAREPRRDSVVDRVHCADAAAVAVLHVQSRTLLEEAARSLMVCATEDGGNGCCIVRVIQWDATQVRRHSHLIKEH